MLEFLKLRSAGKMKNDSSSRSLSKLIVRGLSFGNKIVNRRCLTATTQSAVLFKGKGNRLVVGKGVKLSHCKIKFIGNDCEVIIGDGCRLRGLIIVKHGSQILFGQNIKINNMNSFISCGEKDTRIQVGDGCLFSDPKIRTSDQHSIIDLTTGERINHAKNITIGNRVWIAEGVRIYKGAEIGEGSIIGAGSIVTTKLPSNSLCLGAPAKAVRSNVSWEDRLIPE